MTGADLEADLEALAASAQALVTLPFYLGAAGVALALVLLLIRNL